MKKLILITGMILIGCTLINLLAAPRPAAAPASQAATREVKRFYLTEKSGRLAVYRSGEGEPFLVTETVVSSLPRADRAAIRRGIEIEGEDELRRLLEDYCS